jgi:uncharacterized protein YbbC (DUF1343 family)
MLFGADRLAAEPGLLGSPGPRRLALLTNDAARLAGDADRPTRGALLDAGVPIVRLFSPEHGLGASAPDGAAVTGGPDPLTRLPVVSLYGDALRPPPEALDGIEGVLCDLPDVGARFYTYAWTMTHVVDACAAMGLPVWILDRPNPLGGLMEWVEGPVLEPAYASFLGRHPVPIRHSLTLGELADLWRAEACPGADVRIVRCDGWRRDALWPQLGLPFVPTSPAITRFQAALLYPGTCLFEATNLSVGRGTPLSFEAVGAPWLQATTLAARLVARNLPGLAPEPDRFTPSLGPHAGESCEAVRLRVLDPHRVRPVAAGIALLAEIAALHRVELRWASYPTAANPTGAGHLERLAGTAALRSALEADRPLDAAAIGRLTAAPGWTERAARVAHYPEPATTPDQ